jgi:transcription elongation factor SPT4
MSQATRNLRACMVCSVVQTSAQFNRAGCPNCEEFLELRGNPDSIAEATSQVFEGLITLTSPEQSWVAKWQRLQGYQAGTYAIKVVGQVCGV